MPRPMRPASLVWSMVWSVARQSLGLAGAVVLVAAMIATAQLLAMVLVVDH